jgi:hypothetical protein
LITGAVTWSGEAPAGGTDSGLELLLATVWAVREPVAANIRRPATTMPKLNLNLITCNNLWRNATGLVARAAHPALLHSNISLPGLRMVDLNVCCLILPLN